MDEYCVEGWVSIASRVGLVLHRGVEESCVQGWVSVALRGSPGGVNVSGSYDLRGEEMLGCFDLRGAGAATIHLSP